MFSFIPLCAGRHNNFYHGRVVAFGNQFSPVAKFCSWETSGVEQSTDMAWVWVGIAKRLLWLTWKGHSPPNLKKKKKQDGFTLRSCAFFLWQGRIGKDWRISYLPTDWNSPRSHFFQRGFASEISVANCWRIVLCRMWAHFDYFCIFVVFEHPSGAFSRRNQKIVTESRAACVESLRVQWRAVNMQWPSQKDIC